MITGVLLAAGAAERYGADTLVAALPDGRGVAAAAAAAMVQALPRVLAVVRPGSTELAAALRAAGCKVCPCERADEGMGASLACGVAACPDADGWVVGLADMPWIRADTIARVAAALADGAAVAAPVHGGRRGHPVGFAAALGAELTALAGDQGARAVVAAQRERLRLVETDDPGVLLDVDTPRDLGPDAPAADR